MDFHLETLMGASIVLSTFIYFLFALDYFWPNRTVVWGCWGSWSLFIVSCIDSDAVFMLLEFKRAKRSSAPAEFSYRQETPETPKSGGDFLVCKPPIFLV